MAMVKNESLARMVMLICFGTAILSVAIHWRITTTQGQFKKPASTIASRPGDVYAGGLGETAFGASTPPNKTNQRASQTKSSAMESNINSDTINQNVALTTNTAEKSPLLTPELKQKTNTSEQPRSIFSQIFTQNKSSNQKGKINKQVVVDLSDRRTYVYRGDLVIASYPIAVGKKGWETPTGTFEVNDKQHDPIWRHPITGKVFPAGSDSPLGERWIGFWSDGRNEIGFHGTPDIHLLGAAISHGCLRMRNSDVRLLYEQVGVGMKVVVRE
ncbi:L,D-transpeptidase [Anabaena sp. UHCC 0399]|uniref:L,D-transpeptidase n=1 Tax=Anabaena sp. UHCC 0399 TaxID=3110238 RepID=UPI002B221469|nr:L,D-transpeptidase family protein [Anabaena sp. UHCC 0399]MEA5565668.1 L,D-transpeptidase family protein [Anabaena sp. UHCC 0399]